MNCAVQTAWSVYGEGAHAPVIEYIHTLGSTGYKNDSGRVFRIGHLTHVAPWMGVRALGRLIGSWVPRATGVYCLSGRLPPAFSLLCCRQRKAFRRGLGSRAAVVLCRCHVSCVCFRRAFCFQPAAAAKAGPFTFPFDFQLSTLGAVSACQ